MEAGRRNFPNQNSKLKTPRLPLFLSTPWIGAALIALNPQTIAWGRTGVSDMLLVACMCSALLAFFLGYTLEEQREQAEFSTVSASRFPNKWYLTFYVLIALAILAKGPVGIVVPALIVGCFGLYLGNFRQLWREMRPVSGILIILAIALPWYIFVILANGQTYIDSFFRLSQFPAFYWSSQQALGALVFLLFCSASWFCTLVDLFAGGDRPHPFLAAQLLAPSTAIGSVEFICPILVRLHLWLFYDRRDQIAELCIAFNPRRCDFGNAAVERYYCRQGTKKQAGKVRKKT
jgi:4-amino-4-deoxy-L-arabinose transferase-like glycosyltransferase